MNGPKKHAGSQKGSQAPERPASSEATSASAGAQVEGVRVPGGSTQPVPVTQGEVSVTVAGQGAPEVASEAELAVDLMAQAPDAKLATMAETLWDMVDERSMKDLDCGFTQDDVVNALKEFKELERKGEPTTPAADKLAGYLHWYVDMVDDRSMQDLSFGFRNADIANAVAEYRGMTPQAQISSPTITGYEGIREALQEVLSAKGDIGEDLAGNLVGDGVDVVEDSEVPHEEVSGFIPFTDGGWNLTARTELAAIESRGLRGSVSNAEVEAEIQEQFDRCQEFALEAVQNNEEDWCRILAFLGDKGSAWAPETFNEVMNAINDKIEETGDPKGTGEALREMLYEHENDSMRDEQIDFEIEALCFSPDNVRNEAKKGWEIYLYAKVSFGETYWTRAQPERDHVMGPEVNIQVEPTDTHATLVEKLKEAAKGLHAWLMGDAMPLAEGDYVLPEGKTAVFVVGDTNVHLSRKGEDVAIECFERGRGNVPCFGDFVVSTEVAKEVRVMAQEAGELAADPDTSMDPELAHGPYEIAKDSHAWVTVDRFAVRIGHKAKGPGAPEDGLTLAVFPLGLEDGDALLRREFYNPHA